MTDPKHPLSVLMDESLRYIVLYGGRDAAKSHGVAEALIRRMLKKKLRWLCTREYQTSIKDSVHKLLCDTIERLGVGHRFDVTDKSIRSHLGGEFIFKGLHHDPDGIKSTEGLDGVWVEEAHNTSEHSWRILIPTLRKEGSQIIVTFNTTDEESPTHQRMVIHQPPQASVQLINYDQNRYLSETSKKEIAYLKKHDYQAYLHVYKGEPRKISDSVIFGGRYEVRDFPDDLHTKADRLLYGMDHGFSQDPYAIIRSFIYGKDLYIEHEAFGVGVEFAGNMADAHDSGGERRGELEQLIDSVPGTRIWPIKADNSRPETISFCRNKGFNVEAAEKWKGSVEDGLAFIKGFEHIYIHPRCKHMIQEARLYSYKRDRITGEVLPIIIDKNNHGWDAVRYSLDGYIQMAGSLGTWAKLAG